MKLTWKQLKDNARFSWKKGFVIIAYFLFVSILTVILPYDWPFIIFAWPFYLFPKLSFLAALLELVYVYVIATLLLTLLEHPGKKKK